MGKDATDGEENEKLSRRNPKKINEETNFEDPTTRTTPIPKAHRNCVSDFEKNNEKKHVRTSKKYPNKIVQFIDGTPNDFMLTRLGSSCRHIFTDIERKDLNYNTEIRILDHKFIQCNINETEDCTGVVLPEEIKPLLINVTFLLHELKQKSEQKTEAKLYDLISRIVDLLMELSRRAIKKFDEPKPFEEVAFKLCTILAEHNGPEAEEYENLVMDIALMEQKLMQKNSDVNYVKEQIKDEKSRFLSVSDNVNESLRSSILKNQSLKAEIRFNKMQLRKCSKLMAQKEQRRLKSNAELNTLRKKLGKQQGIIENANKITFYKPSLMDNDVFHGGSMTKYIKSRVVEDKKLVKKKAKKK